MTSNFDRDISEEDQRLDEAIRLSLLEYQQTRQENPSSSQFLNEISPEDELIQAAIENSLFPNIDNEKNVSNDFKKTFTKIGNDDITDLLIPSNISSKHKNDRFKQILFDNLCVQQSNLHTNNKQTNIHTNILSPHTPNRREIMYSQFVQTPPRQIISDVLNNMEMMRNEDWMKILDVIFGSNQIFATNEEIHRWFNHSFVFSPVIHWGLLQQQGGPCGVLAAVQAWILRYLLFNNDENIYINNENEYNKDDEMMMINTNDNTNNDQNIYTNYEQNIQINSEQNHQNTYTKNSTQIPLDTHILDQPSIINKRSKALIHALCAIIFQSTPFSKYQIVYVEPPIQQDEISFLNNVRQTNVWKIEFFNIQNVFHFLYTNLFITQSQTGVISFLCSILLTRGLSNIKDDMDDSTQPMVSLFGHSSQELVNLLVSGRATSNVFDGDQNFGDDSLKMTLKGINKRPVVGFLSALESMRYVQVGQFYKHPYYPVWIIGSSNHYTTLFSPDINVALLSQQETIENEALSAFSQFDTSGDQIISSQFLEPLLNECGMQNYYENARLKLESDCGIILYREFLEWYIQHRLTTNDEKSDHPPNKMYLFYYDGQESNGKEIKYYVILNDISSPYVQSDSSNIALILWTRWPNCSVSTIDD